MLHNLKPVEALYALLRYFVDASMNGTRPCLLLTDHEVRMLTDHGLRRAISLRSAYLLTTNCAVQSLCYAIRV